MEDGFTRDAHSYSSTVPESLPGALLAGEKRLLEMVAQGFGLSQILDSLCRLVEDASAGCH